MKKTPLAIVKERFGDKAGLIKAIQELSSDALWLDRVNSDKGLDSVANKKLLHILDVLNTVKDEFGDRTKLIASLADLEGRGKDADYKAALAKSPSPQLLDLHRMAKNRAA